VRPEDGKVPAAEGQSEAAGQNQAGRMHGGAAGFLHVHDGESACILVLEVVRSGLVTACARHPRSQAVHLCRAARWSRFR
jgi:hypothetical protein